MPAPSITSLKSSCETEEPVESARAVVSMMHAIARIGRVIAFTQRENAGSRAVMRSLGMRMHEVAAADAPWIQVVGVLDLPANAPAG